MFYMLLVYIYETKLNRENEMVRDQRKNMILVWQ